MKITRDVITDLLPAYLSGEASQDTRALVEAYFQQDPEFETLARKDRGQLAALGTSHPAAQQEKETFMRVKRILRLRSVLLGVALFCSLAPFSVAKFSGSDRIWLMLRDLPGLAAVFAVSAVVIWIAYFWTFRALQDT